MSEETKTDRIEVRVHFLDSVYYREFEVASINDFNFNDAGTLLWIQQTLPTDEFDSVKKKAVLIPVHRIESVDVRYY